MAYGWGILPRDLFILLWILMALFLGLYLTGILGKFRKDGHKPGIAGIVTGVASLAFMVWLIPGLWGAPLKAISAFTPPMSTQIFGSNTNTVEPQFTDYNEALKASSASGKPVLIDFTGYGCVNCRKMEASVWTDPKVSEIINGEFILVSLFVDDKTPLKKAVSIVENGTKIKIRTVGDKWSLLQRYKFGANAQPFYVITDSQGNLLSVPYTFDPDPDRFYNFLRKAGN
jgi:thiol:disulfide interchange protein DsbD